MKKEQLVADLEALCAPIVKEKGYDLYHIEYVKENNEYYLRLYIEKPEERISLRDCEIVSRALSDMLDIEDPIKDAYFLEVSSMLSRSCLAFPRPLTMAMFIVFPLISREASLTPCNPRATSKSSFSRDSLVNHS